MKWLMIVLTVAATWTFVQGKDECPQNTVYKFYSDARLSEETGDVLGDELALKPTAGDFYDARCTCMKVLQIRMASHLVVFFKAES